MLQNLLVLLTLSNDQATTPEVWAQPIAVTTAIRWTPCGFQHAEQQNPKNDSQTISPVFRIIADPSFMGRYEPPPEESSVLTVSLNSRGEGVVEFVVGRKRYESTLPGSLAIAIARRHPPQLPSSESSEWFSVRFDASRTYTVISGFPQFGAACVTGVGDLDGEDFNDTWLGRVALVLRECATGKMEEDETKIALESLIGEAQDE